MSVKILSMSEKIELRMVIEKKEMKIYKLEEELKIERMLLSILEEKEVTSNGSN